MTKDVVGFLFGLSHALMLGIMLYAFHNNLPVLFGLSVIAWLANYLAVMRLGKIIEEGERE